MLTKAKKISIYEWRTLVIPGFAACITAGAIIGAVYANILNAAAFEALSANIGRFMQNSVELPQNKNIEFFEALVKYGKLPIIIWFLAFIPPSVFISFALMIAKGAGVGFTTALLVRRFGAYGLVYSFVLYFFQNMVLFPSYIYVSSMSFKFASAGAKEKKTSEYALVLTASLACALLAALIEVYCVPLLAVICR